MRTDPITFEILRHRIWSINEEGANTLERVSGSLIASEVHDMNTSVMTAAGDSLVIAPYMLVHAISMETLAKDVVATCMENPGVKPDDMFLCNDPFAGAQHQMDVVVLGAIHYEGELIGWVGSTIHPIDIGGPVARAAVRRAISYGTLASSALLLGAGRGLLEQARRPLVIAAPVSQPAH